MLSLFHKLYQSMEKNPRLRIYFKICSMPYYNKILSLFILPPFHTFAVLEICSLCKSTLLERVIREFCNGTNAHLQPTYLNFYPHASYRKSCILILPLLIKRCLSSRSTYYETQMSFGFFFSFFPLGILILWRSDYKT